MWTWEQERRRQVKEPAAQLGLVTLGGEETAANLGGERRWLNVCTPGGVGWKPRQGDQVLVLKDGANAWILGVMEEAQAPEPGQLLLSGTDCSVLLGERMEIRGEVDLNGQSLEDYIRGIVADMLSGG